MSEKGKEAGIAVTAEELARINRFAKKELRAEEVYTFAVKLCDNEVDRDFERFDRAALEKLSELFVGRTGIFDHSWSAGGQTARIYRAEVIEEETRTTAGDKYCWCKGWAYMLRTEKNAELIAEIEGGIKKEVSVGCSAAKRSCSICGKDAGLCEHERGKYYGGKLCYAVLSDITDAYEWSFVAVPAQRAAGVVKRFGQSEGSLKAMVRACGSRAQVRELEELEKLLTADQTPQQLLEASAQAAALANQAIQAEAERREECRNMGTTLVSAISYDGGVVVTNVGDSRAYHITEDGITRITKDHSLVESMVDRGDITAEEARRHPSRNLITRALGPDISADCDGYICPMNAGEYLLLCSDGLVNTVTDQEMLFEVIHGDGPDTCLDRLLAIAKRQGAPDNVTAVLMQKQ